MAVSLGLQIRRDADGTIGSSASPLESLPSLSLGPTGCRQAALSRVSCKDDPLWFPGQVPSPQHLVYQWTVQGRSRNGTACREG